MKILKRSENGKVKLIHDGIKVYVNPFTTNDGANVRSAKDRELTEGETVQAYELAMEKTANYLRRHRPNKSSAWEYDVFTRLDNPSPKDIKIR